MTHITSCMHAWRSCVQNSLPQKALSFHIIHSSAKGTNPVAYLLLLFCFMAFLHPLIPGKSPLNTETDHAIDCFSNRWYQCMMAVIPVFPVITVTVSSVYTVRSVFSWKQNSVAISVPRGLHEEEEEGKCAPIPPHLLLYTGYTRIVDCQWWCIPTFMLFKKPLRLWYNLTR